MGTVEARERSDNEPGFDEVEPSDPEFSDVAEHLKKSSGSGCESYNVTKVWRVRRSPLLQAHEARAATLGRPTRLVHGTSLANAKAIAKEGFALPTRAGLYGKGIYFADNPRKSAAYAPESSWMPFFRRWAKDGFLDACMKKESSQMLLCDVYLGKYKLAWGTDSTLSPEKDLQAGWLRNVFGLGNYNSIYAPGLLGHAEYIVYEAHQAIPRYLVEFDIVRTQS